jgi:hypothetical protein
LALHVDSAAAKKALGEAFPQIFWFSAANHLSTNVPFLQTLITNVLQHNVLRCDFKLVKGFDDMTNQKTVS